MLVMVRCRWVGTMPNCFNSISRRLLLIAAASLLLYAACRAPLQIRDVKVNECCDTLCISWTTNYEARCKVTFCDETQCYTTEQEPEWGTLHSNTMPKGVNHVEVCAVGKDGQIISVVLIP